MQNLSDESAMKLAFDHTFRNFVLETIFEASNIEGVVSGCRDKIKKISIPESMELNTKKRFLFGNTGDGNGD